MKSLFYSLFLIFILRIYTVENEIDGMINPLA